MSYLRAMLGCDVVQKQGKAGKLYCRMPVRGRQFEVVWPVYQFLFAPFYFIFSSEQGGERGLKKYIPISIDCL